MSKKVFKVGDRVRTLKNVGCVACKGVMGTVRVIDDSRGAFYGVEFDKNIGGHAMMEHSKPEYKMGHCYFVLEKDLVKVKNPSIHITVDGAKVLAVMKEGKQEVGRGVATCNPSDEFDFKTGAKLAMDRLIGEEIKGNYVAGVREVSRKAKVGEFIRIVTKENGTHYPELKIGDIHKVVRMGCFDKVVTDKRNTFSDEETSEYVVLENYNPEKPMPAISIMSTESKDEYLSFKKIKRRAEVGEYMLVVNAENVPGDDYKNGDIIKCISRDGYHEVYAEGMRGCRKRVLYRDEYVVLKGYQPPRTFNGSTENTFTKEEVLKAVEKALEK